MRLCNNKSEGKQCNERKKVPYLAGKDGFYMQSIVALLKHRSRSPGQRHDIARKFWVSMISALRAAPRMSLLVYNWPSNDKLACQIVPQTKSHVVNASQLVCDFILQ